MTLYPGGKLKKGLLNAMKKIIAIVCLVAIMATYLCSCGSPCERCGESSMSLNLVGDDANGINVCNTCIDKMRMGKIRFNFYCEGCDQEVLGKQNEYVVGGETLIVCNTCAQTGNFQ